MLYLVHLQKFLLLIFVKEIMINEYSIACKLFNHYNFVLQETLACRQTSL
jgi:hypothetical protein